jgi:hypothetical protein
MFTLLTVGIVPLLMAQSSRDYCHQHLRYWFSATEVESQQICSNELKPEFFGCMENRARTSSQDVVTAANHCDPKSTVSVKPIQEPFYFSVKSCPGRLQAGASMRPRRALEVCQWDSREVMIKCLVGLTTHAGFHSEHSLQYCRFAKENYPNELLNFVSCAGREARKGKGTFATAQACHDYILDKTIPKTQKNTPENQASRSSERTTRPSNETRARVVPAPVDIRVQESIKPDVVSNRPVTDLPSNAEVLTID